MLKWLKIRNVIWGVAVFCIALQPLFTDAALALNELPDPSVLAAPTGGRPNNTVQATSNFSFSWNSVVAEPAAEYQLRISDDQTQVGEGPDSSDAWYSGNLATNSMPATTAPLHDGVWYWQVRAITSSGKSTWSEVWKMRIDTTGPAISISQPLDGVMGNVPISFMAEITDSSDISNFIVEFDGQVVTNQVTRAPAEAGFQLSKEWAVGELADGNHTIRVTATDDNGHSTELARLFAIDTAPPEITVSAAENQVMSGVVPVEINSNEPGAYSVRITSGEKEIFAGSTSETENALSYSYSWSTWNVSNGLYKITFTGKDTLGNEVAIVRQITVVNPITPGVVTKDPELEELSAQLNQPLIAPKEITAVAPASIVEPPKVSDLSLEQEVLLKTVPEFVPVAATENGWRLFGVLWYWWFLGGLALAGVGMTIKRSTRTPFSQLPDRV